MNAAIKIGAVALLVAGSVGLSGCVYYPVRTGVAYSGDPAYAGNAVVDDYDSTTTYYAPAYVGGYYDPYWYGPGWYGYGYGWPAVSLGFYGGYWGGHHYYHGPWRGGYRGGSWGAHGGVSARSTVPLSRGARH